MDVPQVLVVRCAYAMHPLHTHDKCLSSYLMRILKRAMAFPEGILASFPFPTGLVRIPHSILGLAGTGRVRQVPDSGH